MVGMKTGKRKAALGDRVFGLVIMTALCIIAVVALVPLLSVLSLSFSSKNAVNMNAVTLLPVEFTLASWKCIFGRSDMWRSAGITFASTAVGTVLALLITATMAYPLSKTVPCAYGRSDYYHDF